MRQWRTFLVRFLLGVWIVFFSAFLFVTVSEARGIQAGPITEVSLEAVGSVREVALPSRIFTCIEAESQTQCQAEIQGRPLVLTLAASARNEVSACEATYNGQRVGCTNNDFMLGAMIQKTFQIQDIGLSPQQLKAVRRKYWKRNMLLDIGEVRLMKIGFWLSIAAGAIAAYFCWHHVNLSSSRTLNYLTKTLVLAISSLGIVFAGQLFFMILFLSTGFAD
ncbi:MAG: hypothetical protein AAFP09_03665 [Cyanobacteria bacterium J06607_10]